MGGRNRKAKGVPEYKKVKEKAYYEEMLKNPNVVAFLQVIRKGEDTLGDAGYHRLFGAVNQQGRRRYLEDLTKHPNYNFIYGFKRDKDGNIIKDKDGKPKLKISSAAGAYQFVTDTWINLARELGLENFGEHNQDIAAVRNIEFYNALEDILNGDIAKAIAKVKGQWTSLPGGSQERQTDQQARTFYQENGGLFHMGSPLSSINTETPGKKFLLDLSNSLKPVHKRGGFEGFADAIFGRDIYKLPVIPKSKVQANTSGQSSTRKLIDKEADDHKKDDSVYSLPPTIIKMGETFDTAHAGKPPVLRLESDIINERKKQDSVLRVQKSLETHAKQDSIRKMQQQTKKVKPVNAEDKKGRSKKGASLLQHGANERHYNNIASMLFPVDYDKSAFVPFLDSMSVLSGPDTPDSKAGSMVNGSYGQPAAININAPLINSFSITTQQIGEAADEIRMQVEQALLEVINNVNTA